MPDTPVLFLIFNRPDLTERVFKNIREARPSKLFIAADGPRTGEPADINLCNEAINIVLNNIDWPCEVQTLLREKNVGCRIAVSGAISWFFEQVEEGIILEDDCLQGESFFKFCSELLEKYRTDERIFHISGNNFQLSNIGEGSYYLSKIPHSWGWATWRRAWKKFDVDMQSFNENNNASFFNDAEIDLYWKQQFARVKNVLVNEWDYQWTYTLFKNEKYAILPQYNLVKNIGFDGRSIRTASADNYFASLKTYELEKIVHPATLSYNVTPDINFQKYMGWTTPIYENRISGSTALRTLVKISKRRIGR